MNIFVRSSLSFVRPTILTRSVATSFANYKNGFDDLFHPDGKEPTIPQYPQHKAESTDIKRARLVYQSRKRGMLENGLILSTFAKKYLDKFDDTQLQLYDELINLPSNDWDIFYWATGVKPIPPEFDNEVMSLLKKHIKNEDRQARIMQPDL